MFDALYPEAADAALNAQMRRPPDAPPPTPWFRGAWSAIGKAIPRAGAEMGRAASTLLTPEAVGAVDAPTMFSAPGKTSKPQLAQEIRQQDTALRDAIKDMTPDAETTGAASMILHDVTRFVGKAAAYSAVGGLPAAVAGVGLDEGTNEALKRMDEGVDPATATKLGIMHGVASAAAVAVPVAGKTLAQTAGLALASGPGSYIGEQATARKILQANGYQEEAERIDPFDPLGLGVSFLGPLLFGAGAHALRGRAPKAADASKPAIGSKVEELPPRTAVAQAIEQAYTREQVDAARVTELQAHRERAALHAPEDVAAGAAHEQALNRAGEQIAAGQRVSVADVAPADGARIAAEVGPVMQRVESALLDLQTRAPADTALHGSSAAFDAFQLMPGRNPALFFSLVDQYGRKTQAEHIAEGPFGGLLYKVELEKGKRFDPYNDPEAARIFKELFPQREVKQIEYPDIHVDSPLIQAMREHGYNRVRVYEPSVHGFSEAITDPSMARIVATKDVKGGGDWVPVKAAEKQPTAPKTAAKVDAGQQPKPAPAKEKSAAAPDSGSTAEAAPSADYVKAEADRIEAESPDMMVMMEGMDQPARVADLLAEAKAMEAQAVADAPLLKVAAECLLMG